MVKKSEQKQKIEEAKQLKLKNVEYILHRTE